MTYTTEMRQAAYEKSLRDFHCEKCGQTLRLNRGAFGTHKRWCGTDWRDFFWPKVQRGEGCWIWTGAKQTNGYGVLGRYRLGAREYVLAHRASWIIANGPVPPGLEVAHRCDIRLCVNPAHLFLATHEENMADAKAKDRHSRGARNTHAKLTEDQARAIKAMPGPHKRGDAARVGALYGVSGSVIGSIWRGDTWKHIAPSSEVSRP